MRHAERERVELACAWPQPPLNIVLVEPEIPPNTGNIARLCAATATVLHLVGPLGFQVTDRLVRRSGLDYWDAVDVRRYPDFDAFLERNPLGNKYFFSTSGARGHWEAAYAPGDHLVFGNESRGLPDALLARHAERVLNIPMRLDRVRSLNLSNCAAIALYEALRQCNLPR